MQELSRCLIEKQRLYSAKPAADCCTVPDFFEAHLFQLFLGFDRLVCRYRSDPAAGSNLPSTLLGLSLGLPLQPGLV
jgi:hypothetical protein